MWVSEYAKVQHIDHSEIISSKYLPTFNSHVIEAHLHNIPNLAENFIYFNDDVFVARELPPGHFFKGNGLASIFISRKSLIIKKIYDVELSRYVFYIFYYLMCHFIVYVYNISYQTRKLNIFNNKQMIKYPQQFFIFDIFLFVSIFFHFLSCFII